MDDVFLDLRSFLSLFQEAALETYTKKIPWVFLFDRNQLMKQIN